MAQCSCVNIYDFDLDQTKCSDIIYLDRSNWSAGEIYATTGTYELTITSPGGNTYQYTVTQGIPLHLNLGECVTPGIWTFSVVSCKEKFTKKVAILCEFYCAWLKSTAKIAKGVDVNIVRSIRERLEYITQLVGYGDTVTAQELVSSTGKDLKKIECSCSCF